MTTAIENPINFVFSLCGVVDKAACREVRDMLQFEREVVGCSPHATADDDPMFNALIDLERKCVR